MTDSNTRPARIAVVDDEEVVTRTIKSFLELETEYEVLTFQSPVSALDAIERARVDLVISDFLMPEMSGLEFLAEVKKRHPETVRVMLTGYADKENAIRAINEVELFQYLEKPWDNDQLVLTIRNGLRSRSLSCQLGEKINELDRTILSHDRLSQQHERLKEELVLARRVQQTLLPQHLPAVGGVRFAATYRPALDVGGDFYDVIELDGGVLAVFVADATGHGVQAALSTALLKSAFTEFANRSAGSCDMLRDINRALHNVLPADIFIAATLATIEAGSRRVSVTNGGGPHPFRVIKGGGVTRVASNGLLLGAVDPSVYEPGDEVTVTLEPGDRVVFYTDGLTEVENAEGDDFGECGIVAALEATSGLSLGEVNDHLVARAEAHAREGHEWDDVTILTVEMTG